MSLLALVALVAKMCVLLLPNIQMLAMSLTLGNWDFELGDHMPTTISLKHLLWDAYFSTDKRPLHNFTDFSNLKCSPGIRQ